MEETVQRLLAPQGKTEEARYGTPPCVRREKVILRRLALVVFITLSPYHYWV